jgi:ankyrin repeat protein
MQMSDEDMCKVGKMTAFIITTTMLAVVAMVGTVDGLELDPDAYIPDPNAPEEDMPPELSDDIEWEKANENTNLALGMACLYGETDMVKKALVNGQMLEMDHSGFARVSNHHELHHSKKRILYDRDWRFSHKNELNDTCLHRAVTSREYDIAKLLLEHGWDPNALDKNGHTPLDVAHSRHDELLSHLLEDRGALAQHHVSKILYFLTLFSTDHHP